MKQSQNYSELKITLTDISWVVLGGIFLGLSFPPVGWYVFAWVSFIPLFRVCVRFSARETFILAWIFHVSLVAVAFYWPVLHLLLDTALISLVAMVALTMLLSIPFAVAAAVIKSRLTNKRKIAGIILAGFLVFTLDLILQVGPVPMPWLSLGNTQAMSSLVERFAPFIGSIGIGLLVLSGNMFAAIGSELKDIRLRSRVALAITLPVTIMLVLLLPSGQHELHGRSVRLGILQPGIPARDWAQIQNLSRVDTLLELSKFVLTDTNKRPEFIIWPETALPYSGNSRIDENTRLILSAWAVRNHVGILSGAITESSRLNNRATSDTRTYFRNTVSLFDSEGKVAHHGKNILVPFAEYVPLSLTFPALTSLSVPAGGVAGYLPEEIPSVFQTSTVTFGVMICFESAFPRYARSLTKAGSQFLVVITQDGWWNSRAPGAQHFYYSRYRAAETGRSVIQVSVDGISGVILPDGSIQTITGIEAQTQLIVDVPIERSETFFMRFGDFMLILAIATWIAALYKSFSAAAYAR